MENGDFSAPHVLLFPLPVQGHISPMLNLGELLSLANFQVTFLTTTQNHQRMTTYSDIDARFARYPAFKFKVIPDGPPVKQWSSHGDLKDWLVNLAQGLEIKAKPLLGDILNGSTSTIPESPVTCLILDGWLSFAYELADVAKVPVIAFRGPSAGCMWANFCTPKLIEAREVPFQDEDLDCLVQNAPGMDSFLRYRDLPSFCRSKDKPTCQSLQQALAAEIQRTTQAQGLILNTFEDLEGPIISLLRSQCSKVYSIGPLHAHIKQRLNQEKTALCKSSSSLWEADQSCLSWLDQKPDKSVIYVGFGSLTILERKQILEIWAGLVQSKKYFLWVIRPNLIIPSDTDSPTPPELLEATKERGCIVSWSPQEAVLAHRAIGGFLTHSGWNSTLESITAGVPMLCWPYFADQQVNSRYVSEVWRIGLDMKDTCDRDVVEKMVHDLMDGRKEEFQGVMAKMSELAKRSITEGGSSYNNLDRLIQDIKMMSIKGAN